MKSLNEFLNEGKQNSNNYKIEDFSIGSIIRFKDGEEWKVVKSGMRGSGESKSNDEITIYPSNQLAKKNNISKNIDIRLDYLNKNVESIIDESLTENQFTNKIEGFLANPGWTVVTYPRKIGGSKPEAHMGQIVSIKGTKLVVNFGGKVGGTTETLDLIEDIGITYDNVGTFTALASDIIANTDEKNIHSFVGRSKVTKFATLDKQEFDKAFKGTIMEEYMKRKDMTLS